MTGQVNGWWRTYWKYFVYQPIFVKFYGLQQQGADFVLAMSRPVLSICQIKRSGTVYCKFLISKSIKMVHNGSLKVKAQILNEPPHGEEKLTHSSNLGGTCDTAEIWISSLWRGMWRVMRRINRSYRDSNLQSPFFLCVSHPRGEAAGKQSL